jgi:peptidoglycan/LPS O-acetylase OafA/YrhL
MAWQTAWTDPVKDLLFALVSIPFFRFCLQEKPSGRKIPLLLPIAVYAGLVFMLLRQPDTSRIARVVCFLIPPGLVLLYWMITGLRFKGMAVAAINRFGAILGKYSYSLYIGHLPVLMLCAHFFPHRPLIYLSVSLPCVALLAYLMESHLQPAVTALFRRQPAEREKEEGKLAS